MLVLFMVSLLFLLIVFQLPLKCKTASNNKQTPHFFAKCSGACFFCILEKRKKKGEKA